MGRVFFLEDTLEDIPEDNSGGRTPPMDTLEDTMAYTLDTSGRYAEEITLEYTLEDPWRTPWIIIWRTPLKTIMKVTSAVIAVVGP
jgi:hypothetical protein